MTGAWKGEADSLIGPNNQLIKLRPVPVQELGSLADRLFLDLIKKIAYLLNEDQSVSGRFEQVKQLQLDVSKRENEISIARLKLESDREQFDKEKRAFRELVSGISPEMLNQMVKFTLVERERRRRTELFETMLASKLLARKLVKHEVGGRQGVSRGPY
jgi:hypothetical protein